MIDELIDKVLEGEDVEDVVDVLATVYEGESPFNIRKKIRADHKALYDYLTSNGVLHDFAVDISNGLKVKEALKKYEVPENIVKSTKDI